jgi:hypothetical protein
MPTRFREIAARLTGVSCPIFGVSWNPPKLDRDVARRVLTFLEDRRVLYAPDEVEIRSHCIESVLRIREMLTEVLGDGGIADDLEGHVRAMRAACRLFLERAGPVERDRHPYEPMGLHDWMLNQAIGELRGTFGVQVAQVAVKYGLDVEDPLASILPPSDT